MAKTVLEAQAIISATDKTGAVFSSIAQKVKGLESAMKGASSSSAPLARTTSVTRFMTASMPWNGVSQTEIAGMPLISTSRPWTRSKANTSGTK